jgi:hypothetical protein
VGAAAASAEEGSRPSTRGRGCGSQHKEVGVGREDAPGRRLRSVAPTPDLGLAERAPRRAEPQRGRPDPRRRHRSTPVVMVWEGEEEERRGERGGRRRGGRGGYGCAPPPTEGVAAAAVESHDGAWQRGVGSPRVALS